MSSPATYKYIGRAFDMVPAGLSDVANVTASITFSASLEEIPEVNTGSNMAASVMSFRFSDGVTVVTDATPFYDLFVTFSVNPDGSIASWSASVTRQGGANFGGIGNWRIATFSNSSLPIFVDRTGYCLAVSDGNCVQSREAQIFESGVWGRINTVVHVQSNLRQCSGEMSCVGGDPSIEAGSDADFGEDGFASKQIIGPTLGTQSSVSAGYAGVALAPAISAYAYTEGPVRYTIGALGIQRFRFLVDAVITINGTLTYSQSGQTVPSSQNPRGRTDSVFMTFQMDDNVFDPQKCNIYNLISGPGVFNEAGAITSCLRFNGQFLFGQIVDFDGLQNFQESEFNTDSGPVTNNTVSNSLVVNGSAGDVFFLAANLGGRAHLGGFIDSSNTLLIEIDQPQLVEPAFAEESFVPAEPRLIEIDVKPGSDPNCINIDGNGVIPVAILGSSFLDVGTLDPESLRFNGLAVRVKRNGRLQCSAEYSNADQYQDLVCQFQDDVNSWSHGGGVTGTVDGSLNDGRRITGFDTICLVP